MTVIENDAFSLQVIEEVAAVRRVLSEAAAALRPNTTALVPHATCSSLDVMMMSVLDPFID